MAEDLAMEWPTIRESDWPHGIRCIDCQESLRDGQPFMERMEGFVGETPTTEVVCLPCGGGSISP